MMFEVTTKEKESFSRLRRGRERKKRTGNTRTNGTTPFRFFNVNLVCSIDLICSFCVHVFVISTSYRRIEAK